MRQIALATISENKVVTLSRDLEQYIKRHQKIFLFVAIPFFRYRKQFKVVIKSIDKEVLDKVEIEIIAIEIPTDSSNYR
jgi:hypothetical protein